MNLPIHISEEALAEAKSIFATKGISDTMGLRIGVKGSGCSGTSFFLGFDEQKEHDQVFEIDEMKIWIEKKHFLYLAGMKLDFIADSSQRGFSFVSIN